MAESNKSAPVLRFGDEIKSLTRARERPRKCNICKFHFNTGDCCPKMLPCGHTMCALCIKKLVANNAHTCPFCYVNFHCVDIDEFPTNLTALLGVKVESSSEKSDEEVDDSSTEDAEFSETLHMMKTQIKEMCQEILAQHSSTDFLLSKEIQSHCKFGDNLMATSKDLSSVIDKLIRLREENAHRLTFLLEARFDLERTREKNTQNLKRVKDIEAKSESAEDFSSFAFVAENMQSYHTNAKDFDDNLQKALPDLEQTWNALEKEHQTLKENIDRIGALPCFEDKTEGHPKNTRVDLLSEFNAIMNLLP